MERTNWVMDYKVGHELEYSMRLKNQEREIDFKRQIALLTIGSLTLASAWKYITLPPDSFENFSTGVSVVCGSIGFFMIYKDRDYFRRK